ncbi:uncharacterized protein L3040_000151 [Drepanopeziza brunnea f. sp. 'multigermtubi']|uniref:Uncharacterized protein n=1 Tax=Marssonina brunnea f. sp. multigermtubi (strain MB_m1) TaxID=1072389 RepID=K1X1B7_MARBU|nr:uncharacterized protein MBM_07349 [Drepanopeziza brunnea f. sp. 'multigermtubi' MB_m1]EKD14628.1 hypothetical protein MBM_07349 [Drepanopeziza brunnea f. sp. 'multigermtubi' MB_m1]KAJ5053861.1 hypothetical protein L3040_000151 [Drepanopeziza brunnea f. sp. 'multigermtubi']
MDSPEHTSLPSLGSIFGNYQFGAPSQVNANDGVPESPFTVLPATQQTFGPPASPPVIELAAFSLECPAAQKSPPCGQCRGARFDFTKYFHNEKFFRAPPHELLKMIEQSYLLKNRLGSILVTYIVHNLHDDHRMADILTAITDWVDMVASLIEAVSESMINAAGVADALAAVEAWTSGFAGQLREHLGQLTGQKMEVPAGWKKQMLSEFRKRWESVWIRCANACAYHQDVVSMDQD